MSAFPRALSHIGLVNAAWAIAEAERGEANRLDSTVIETS